jgi:hypothetical protein
MDPAQALKAPDQGVHMLQVSSWVPRESLEALSSSESSPWLSLYAGTERAGPAQKQNRKRIRDLLLNAEREAGLVLGDQGAARRLARPLHEALEREEIWEHPRNTAAALCREDELWLFFVDTPAPERVLVTEHPHLKPLFHAHEEEQSFSLLALSQNDVRFFEGDRLSLRDLQLPGMPKSMEEALGEQHRDKSLQHHSAGKKANSVYHGHGAAKNDDAEDFARFLRAIDARLREHQKKHPLPLLIAGVDEHRNAFRRLTRNPLLLDQSIAWTPSRSRMQELHSAARAALEAHRAQQQDVTERVGRAIARDQGSADLQKLLEASEAGRIQELAVASDGAAWGRIERDDIGRPRALLRSSLERKAGDVDLLDVVASKSFRSGALVKARTREELPHGSMIVGSFRY